MKVRYKLASSTWDDKEIEAIKKVVSTGFYTMGDFVSKFESNFADFFKSKYAVMVNSGSSANLLAIASLFFIQKNPLKKGDEVIVPCVSWSTTYTPLQQYGLKVKFVDIDLKTLNYDVEKLNDAVSDKTRLIVAVNLLGNPNNFNKINSIIANRDILLFEDNCESMGAMFNRKYTGTFGVAGTFSSFFSHHISTMEGGIILTNNTEIYNILLSIRAHGWTRNLKDNNPIHVKNKNKFYESFNFILPGYNLRPLEFSGAIGLEQLKKLPNLIRARKNNASYFYKLFSSNENFIIQKEIGESSWFGFSLILNKQNISISRDDLVLLMEKNGIETRPIVSGNFLNNKVLKYFDYEVHGDPKNAEYVDKNGIFIGNHHYDLSEELDYLNKIIKNID
ncbi:MAG: pyridoxamine 5-phosphate oxidase [Chloroflexi bacterium]|jgi:CDP-6-deoxy-D-xylo-4-hexulose-3-dehydrase|nr:pyridoxamine 5-phosphate oxidase [Chloroflexota bacterium]